MSGEEGSRDGEGMGLPISDVMVERVKDIMYDEGGLPYGSARIQDFTDEQIRNGELAAADRVGDDANDAFVRRVIAAVAPDIAAAAVRAALAPLVDGTRQEGPADADDPAALLAREVRRQCAEQVRAVAAAVEAGNLYDEPLPAAIAKELRALAASWDEEQVRRCDSCGAVCDSRVQVCECTPGCSYPPVAR